MGCCLSTNLEKVIANEIEFTGNNKVSNSKIVLNGIATDFVLVGNDISNDNGIQWKKRCTLNIDNNSCIFFL